MEDKMIKLGDFGTIESKELVEKEIFRRIKPKVGSWVSRCYQKTLMSPYKTASFRSVVYPKALDEQAYLLMEGITPDPTGRLTFVEQTMSVSPRGFYALYTDEDMTYGFDAIVPELTNSVSLQAEDVMDQIAGKAWANGNQVWTAESGLTRELFNKIRISMKKFTRNKTAVVKAILTPEDITDLRLTYNKAGANLFQDTSLNEESVKNGVIARFEGVDIEEDDSAIMYERNAANELTGKRFAYFYILDSDGRLPVGFIKADGENGKFIANALGSAGTEDPLDQRGSIGVKFKGLGALITAEECLARVVITPADDTIGYIDSEIDEFGNIVANGEDVARTNVRDTKASPKSITLVSNGLTVATSKTLSVKAYDELGKEVSTGTWATTDTAIATVSKGVVTGVKAGTTTLTLTVAGYPVATLPITVK